jgi:hypothetical protein
MGVGRDTGEMGWLRPRVKLGACLALLALALNLACAVGHHHFDDIARGLVAAGHSSLAAHGDEDGDHHHSTDSNPCFVCVVVTAAAIAAAPPALLARSPAQNADVTSTFFELRDSKRTSFEARAPPQA